MSDLIDRQKAIKVMSHVNDSICGQQVIDELWELPSENQWIPVSERLPIDMQVVNVTWINTNPPHGCEYMKDIPYTTTCVYHWKKWYWYSPTIREDLAEGYDCEPVEDEIIIVAWMPLPEPWKGKENDK